MCKAGKHEWAFKRCDKKWLQNDIFSVVKLLHGGYMYLSTTGDTELLVETKQVISTDLTTRCIRTPLFTSLKSVFTKVVYLQICMFYVAV